MPYAPREIHLSGKFRGLIVAVENVTELPDENGGESTPENACSSQSSSPCTNPRVKKPTGSLSITHAQLELMMSRFQEKAHQDYILGSPRVDQLPNPIQRLPRPPQQHPHPRLDTRMARVFRPNLSLEQPSLQQ
jgi:hypothetical protein